MSGKDKRLRRNTGPAARARRAYSNEGACTLPDYPPSALELGGTCTGAGTVGPSGFGAGCGAFEAEPRPEDFSRGCPLTIWASLGTHWSHGFALGSWSFGSQPIQGWALRSSSVMFWTELSEGGHHALQGWACPGSPLGSWMPPFFFSMIVQVEGACPD
jgi:hypothetical protein